MRWRDLSPRFYVKPFVELEPASLLRHRQNFVAENKGHKSASEQSALATEAENTAPLQERYPDSGVASVPEARNGEKNSVHHARTPVEVDSSASADYAGRNADSIPANTSRVKPMDNLQEVAAATQFAEVPSKKAFINDDIEPVQETGSPAQLATSAKAGISGSLEAPDGCIPFITDMSLFGKFGWPPGRLISTGPSGSKMLNEVKNAAGIGIDGSWRPKVIGSEMKCPPVVQPDTCGLTASYSRVHNSPWVWRFERDGKTTPLDGDNLDYADIVWIFRGTFVSKVGF